MIKTHSMGAMSSLLFGDFLTQRINGVGNAVDGNIFNISLLRTPVYSAHPIGDRPLADPDRSHDRIDIGERDFEFRLTADTSYLDKQAEIFNQPCVALSFFPSGLGEKKDTRVEIDNSDIILSRYEKTDDGIKIRLFNSSESNSSAVLTIRDKDFKIDFGAFEVKTFNYANEVLTETDMI